MHGAGVFVWDSPGVMMAKVSNAERGLRLALLGCVREGAVDPMTLARYLLHICNTSGTGRNWTRGYGEPFDLPALTWDLDEVLAAAQARLSGSRTAHECARHWVGMFQRGELGRWTLDDPDGSPASGVIVDMAGAELAVSGQA
jgi:ribosome biogenesis GTPase A